MSLPHSRSRSLFLFLCARGAASMAYQMAGVAIGWQIYELTHSALALGLVGLVQFIPSLLLVLYVGHLSDRHDRRRIIFLGQTIEALALAGLLVAIVTGHISRELVFAAVFTVGVGRSFEYSTMQSLVASLVEAPALPQALAASSSVKQVATIIGPMVGGVLYLAGPGAVYGCCLTLFLASAILISIIKVRPYRRSSEPFSWTSLLGGIRFIRTNRVVLGAISLDLFAVLLGGATALLPIFARDILHTGPEGLGLLRSAPALGALAASLYLARNPLRRKVGQAMFAAVACFGLMTIVFALSSSLVLSCVALALLGAADMVSVVIRASLVQLETPDAMRGRVSAVNSIFVGSSNELGEFESGLLAAWLGAVPAALIGGIGTLVVVGLWLYLFPQLLKRERLQPQLS